VTLQPVSGGIVIDRMEIEGDLLNIMPASGDIVIGEITGNLRLLNIMAVNGNVTISNITGSIEHLLISTASGDIEIENMNLSSCQSAQILAYNGSLTRGTIQTGSATPYIYAANGVLNLEGEAVEGEDATGEAPELIVLGGEHQCWLDEIEGATTFKIEELSSSWARHIVVSFQAFDQQPLTGQVSVDGAEIANFDNSNLYYTTITLAYNGESELLFDLLNATGRQYDIRWHFTW